MFGFIKKEETFNPVFTGVKAGEFCNVYNLPVSFSGAVAWLREQLAAGREAAFGERKAGNIAALVSCGATAFAERTRYEAAKRDSEIAALQAENSALNGTVCALRDSLDQACKDNEALQAELDDACEDADALCDALDEADELIASLRSAMTEDRKCGKRKKGAN
jgi:chromosome segregation ATPase